MTLYMSLKRCAGSILDREDGPLFEDAVAAARGGALRASYLMIWLSCAESIRRRFSEARKRDHVAGKIYSHARKKEAAQHSVDRYLLDEAWKYGFLSLCGYNVLKHVYQMRSVYAHPYEQAPSEEEVLYAATSVVKYVLSKPVILRHGFISGLLENMMQDHNYLDDIRPAVTRFAKDVIKRIDPSLYGYLLENYWSSLEQIAEDSSMMLFFRRGIWFSQATLKDGAESPLFSDDEWHDRVRRFPRTLSRVCSTRKNFTVIGERARDSLVGAILEESGTRPRVLKSLEYLLDGKRLSVRQGLRYSQYLREITFDKMCKSGLRIDTCYSRVIDELRSYNWYTQNPAVEFVWSKGADEVEALSPEKQRELGRNILQAGDGGANSAIHFLANMKRVAALWPHEFVLGVCIETFVNESGHVRFKTRCLSRVLEIIGCLPAERRGKLIEEVVNSVDSGHIGERTEREEFDGVAEMVGPYSNELKDCLERKAEPPS